MNTSTDANATTDAESRTSHGLLTLLTREREIHGTTVNPTPAIIVTLIAALGATLRFYELGQASYWVDEVYSATFRGAVPLLDLLTIQEPIPPLYYAFLKYWMVLFGQGEFATRSLSALFGVGSIVAIYFVATALFNRRAGYIAALLLAVSVFILTAINT
jgi:uncharacterized membrane protein